MLRRLSLVLGLLCLAGCGQDAAVNGAVSTLDAVVVQDAVTAPEDVHADVPLVDAAEPIDAAVELDSATDAVVADLADALPDGLADGTDAAAAEIAPDDATADLATDDAAAEPDGADTAEVAVADDALTDTAEGPDAALSDVAEPDAADADAAEVDGPEVDAAEVDAGCPPAICPVPSGPCDADHPCAAGVCDPQSQTCVVCATSADCPAGLCENHACAGAPVCQSDAACKGAGKVCAIALGVCVECAIDADCLGAGVCLANQCVAQVKCASSKECAVGTVCDAASGLCAQCSKSADCGFGQFCNDKKQCQTTVCFNNVCVGDSLFLCKPDGTGFLPSKSCADGNPCTTDQCETNFGCTHTTANGAVCDDGDACTSGDVCDGTICFGAALTDCNDGNPCTMDSCNATTGCSHTPYLGACDDASVCTTKDSCKTGACTGLSIPCEDGALCTADGCDPVAGCVFLPISSTCTDGNPCTVSDNCYLGSCQGAAPLVCDDGDPCTNDSCAPSSGCQTTAATGPACDDGSACTSADACVAGKCAGAGIACTDSNPCTSDSCDPHIGCAFFAKPGPCDDGDPCSLSDACTDSACQPGAAKVCNDGDPCTVDSCKAMVGCVTGPVSGVVACTDGNPCTGNDTCGVNGCAPGALVNCDDNDKCTTDACSSLVGCVHGATLGGCDDGDACTLDGCSANTCSNKAVSMGLWTSGGGSDDGAVGVWVDAAGTTTVLGSTQSKGAGGGDFWLQQVNAAGVTVLDVTKGTSANDTATAMVPRAAGGFWLVGKTANGGLGGDDAWLLGVDAAGKTVVDVKAGTADNDAFYAVAAMPDGGVVAAGARGAGTNGLGALDAWVVRYSATGLPLWTVPTGIFGAAANDMALAVTVTTGGDIVVATVIDNTSAGTSNDPVVFRLDSAGKLLWRTAVNDNNLSDIPRALIQVSDGSFLVGGDIATSSTNQDAWVARLTSGGARVWVRTYGGALNDALSGISQVPGGFLFTGVTANATAGKSDAWLVRLDNFGVMMCAETYGGSDDDSAAALQPMADGRVVWVGSTRSSGAGGADVWRVIVDAWGHASCAEAGVCAWLTRAACDDGTSCTADSCDPVTGCLHPAITGGCSDGNPCTSGDTCTNNVCAPTGIAACDDKDPCTTDVCDPTLGCYHTWAPDGTACSDNNVCTTVDTCQNHNCVGTAPKACPSNGNCQHATCDPVSGCGVTYLANGTVCGSYSCGVGSSCTMTCNNGACN